MREMYKPIIMLWAVFLSFIVPYYICKLLFLEIRDGLIGIIYTLLWLSLTPLLFKLDETLDKKL